MGGAGAGLFGSADVWIVLRAGTQPAAVSGGGAGGVELWIGGAGRGAPGGGPGVHAGAGTEVGAAAAGASGEGAIHGSLLGASDALAGRAWVDGLRGNPAAGAGGGISGLGAQSILSRVCRAAGVDTAVHDGD